MRTVQLIERFHGKLSIIIGSRPGTEYAGVSDRAVMEDVDAKVTAVEAFVGAHDPDIVNTIAGTVSEAESLGAGVTVYDEGSPRVTESPLTDIARGALSPRALEESPLCLKVLRSIGRLAETYPDKIVSASVSGPLTVLGHLVGLDRFLLLSIDDPSLVRELLSQVTERIVEYARAQCERGARYVAVSDPTASLFSPGPLRETALPFHRRLFDILTMPNHLHVCGDTTNHLPVLGETGAQAVSVDTMVDMRSAVSVLPPDVAVIGNIDAAGVLLRGMREDVREAAKGMRERMRDIRTYIPGTSCGVPRRTPRENIQAFLDAVREVPAQ
jgi:MtaA/CmuA family methyltransferase